MLIRSMLTSFSVVVLVAQLCMGQATAQKASSVLPSQIVPPEVKDGKAEITLPAIVDNLDVGGGGRYIALHFKTLHKIGIFDVNLLKIIGYIPAADADSKFAAGATKLILVSGDSGVISRWDLATQQRELAQTIDLKGAATHALLGSMSEGPAIVSSGAGGHNGTAMLVDLKTLQTKPFVCTNNYQGFDAHSNARISANGDVFSLWASGSSPSGLQTCVKVGDTWTGYREHTSVGAIVPSPDGKLVHTGRGLYTHQLRKLGGEKDFPYSIPAVHGPYYLHVSGMLIHERIIEKKQEKFVLKLEGDDRPLAEIPHLTQISSKGEHGTPRGLTLDKRVMLIPDANLVLQLDQSDLKLIAIHFDVEAALRASEVDFLVVSSRPPLAVKAGAQFQYQIEVKSKAGGVKYSLDAAPKGMELSPTGLLTWNTNNDSPATNDVIVSVRNSSDQQVFHTFNLPVEGGATVSQVANAITEIIANPDASVAAASSKVNKELAEIKLPSTISEIVIGGSGRLIFIHLRDLKKIAICDVRQQKIVGYIPAGDDNTKFVAGATKALVFSLTQGVVTRYRLDTFERELSVAIPFTGTIQYMGMGAGSEGPVLLRTCSGSGQIDRCVFHFLDIGTLKPIEVKWPRGHQPHSVNRDRNQVRVSTNGQAYVVGDLGLMRLNGTSVELSGDRGTGFALPTADGRHFLVNGRLFNASLKQVGDAAPNLGNELSVPSVTGAYYIHFTTPQLGSPFELPSAKLYLIGDNRPLVTIQDLGLSSRARGDNQPVLDWDKRVLLIPDEQVLVTVADTNDRLLLRQFNIDDALEASGVDYLVVTSQAPSQAQRGQPYRYAIQVKSKRGNVKYNLDAAPEGMTVSNDGEISWEVPQSLTENQQHVIVSIGDDSGQQVFHAFAIEIPGLKDKLAATQQERAEQQRLAEMEVQRRARAAHREHMAAQQRQPPATDASADAAADAAAVAEAAISGTDAAAARAPAFQPVVRTWTDSSGKHTLQGKFVEIANRTTVILQLETGEVRKIPLARLSDKDIYEAVQSDLLRQGAQLSGPQDSPFQTP